MTEFESTVIALLEEIAANTKPRKKTLTERLAEMPGADFNSKPSPLSGPKDGPKSLAPMAMAYRDMEKLRNRY